MTALSAEDVALTDAAFAVKLRAMPKDKSYQKSEVGTMVGRYIRWFRNEWGATPSTVRDYEDILARMSVALADRKFYEVSTDDLRAIIESFWGKRSAGTRRKVTSVIRAFWQWSVEQGHIAISPAAPIKRPRGERKIARTLPLDARPRLLEQAKSPRDRLGLYCLLVLGIRKAELAGIQIRDIDVQRGNLRVFGKGRKERLLPMRGPILAEAGLLMSTDLPYLDRLPQADDYLLYPIRLQAAGKGRDGLRMERVSVAYPKDRPSSQSVHRWWYRQAQNAGLVGPGVTAGLNMHQARHTFAMELRRVAGIDAASHALGHADLNTTLGIYGHYDGTDLETAMESYADWLGEQDAK
ncbi:MAG TPA: tyrosine-type recombinase/integrase [Vicinamibacterales bacterium]|nr:tyrosine-type recombinase/integrase [Vicinamibacterales bacterium]